MTATIPVPVAADPTGPTAGPTGPTAVPTGPTAGAGRPASALPEPAGSRGKSRLRLMLAGVVAVIAIAGGVVLATGGDDEADTSSPAGDESPTDGEAGAAGSAGGSDTGGADDPDPDAGDDADAAPSSSDESPVEVAEAFFAAVESSDCAGIVGRMTPESFGALGQSAAEAVTECEDDAAGTAAAAAAEWDDVRLVSEDGDQATVAVTVTVGNEETERELPLRRVDGEWRLHLDTSLAAPAG